MFYGDNNRWFVATVKSNDPEKRGRYKIRIHGLHSSDVKDKHLPYAETMLPTTEGGVSGTGNLESESSFNPTANFKNSVEDSWGLAQWNDAAGRLQPLKDYATAKNADWQDFFIQLEFLIVDMQTNDWVRHRVWPRLSNNKLTTRFEGVLDDFNATWNFFNNYEIAATEKYYTSGREKNAAKAFYQYQSSLQSTLDNLGIS